MSRAPSYRDDNRPRILPHAPTIPVLLGVVHTVLRNRGKRPSWSRIRTLAALAAALAVPCGWSLARFARLQPHEVEAFMASRGVPPFAKRRVREWLDLREVLEPCAESWLASHCSRGLPHHLGFAVTRLLARRGTPPWRLRDLLDGPRWIQFDPKPWPHATPRCSGRSAGRNEGE